MCGCLRNDYGNESDATVCAKAMQYRAVEDCKDSMLFVKIMYTHSEVTGRILEYDEDEWTAE